MEQVTLIMEFVPPFLLFPLLLYLYKLYLFLQNFLKRTFHVFNLKYYYHKNKKAIFYLIK